MSCSRARGLLSAALRSGAAAAAAGAGGAAALPLPAAEWLVATRIRGWGARGLAQDASPAGAGARAVSAALRSALSRVRALSL